jgi:hypothetical protein
LQTVLTRVRPEEDISREKALQTVVAGQQAENLLDFDADEPTTSDGDGRRASEVGMISSQAIATAAKASNPLDELMDLFSSASMAAPAQIPEGPMGLDTGGGMGGMGMNLMSPTNGSPALVSLPDAGKQAGKAEDDLLGLF